jgi:hypothetical protein
MRLKNMANKHTNSIPLTSVKGFSGRYQLTPWLRTISLFRDSAK